MRSNLEEDDEIGLKRVGTFWCNSTNSLSEPRQMDCGLGAIVAECTSRARMGEASDKGISPGARTLQSPPIHTTCFFGSAWATARSALPIFDLLDGQAGIVHVPDRHRRIDRGIGDPCPCHSPVNENSEFNASLLLNEVLPNQRNDAPSGAALSHRMINEVALLEK